MSPSQAANEVASSTPEMTGRILIASYHFPPDAAVGALRLAKAARLLPEFGWQPYILTVRDEYREQGIDASRLKGLEGVSIVRTGALPRVIDLLASAKRLLGGGAPAAGAVAAATAEASVASPSGETLRQRLTRAFVSLIVRLPDDKKHWSIRAAVDAVTEIRKHRIDWVLTSGPPFSGHFIGLVAKLFTRAKWIADFRDPWLELLAERYPSTRTRLSDRIEGWMEAAVMSGADKIAVTTERMRTAMSSRYPRLPQSKFVCIPNSIDTASFPAQAADRYDTLTITYAGTLYFDRTPEPLFKAVQKLIESGTARRGDIRIKLLGNCRQIEGVDTLSIADRYGVRDEVEIVDRVPYQEALRIMQRSHLLLTLAPERHRLVIPAKIFDYLGSGSKILALAEPGATADLMEETQCGRCFSERDIDGIRDYLASLLKDGSFKSLRNEPQSFSSYDARAIVGRLAAEMSATPAPVSSVMVRT
jgi:glycosyltransferase involved in cell wall biosynthesis